MIFLFIIEHVCIVVFIAKIKMKNVYNEVKINKEEQNTTSIETNVTVVEDVQENKANNWIFNGCRRSLQTLLFCYALKEGNVSFAESEIQLSEEHVMVTFRKRRFPIIIPLSIIRTCYSIKNGEYFQCNALSSHIEKSSEFSYPEEKYYLQIIYLVLMKILPQMGGQYDPGHYFPYFRFEESYASDDPKTSETLARWKSGFAYWTSYLGHWWHHGIKRHIHKNIW